MVRPEFSRPVLVDTIPNAGMRMEIEADPAERQALATRFGILGIASLRASLRLKAMAGGTLFRVDGHVSAQVTQACVVTLEPVEQGVEEDFTITFGAGATSDMMSLEVDLDLEDDDPPDPVVDGAIDVGETVAEHLALALDPFPRKLGAHMAELPEPEPQEEVKVSPFASLAVIKQKKR